MLYDHWLLSECYLYNHKLATVTNAKYLGIALDSMLSFNSNTRKPTIYLIFYSKKFEKMSLNAWLKLMLVTTL